MDISFWSLVVILTFVLTGLSFYIVNNVLPPCKSAICDSIRLFIIPASSIIFSLFFAKVLIFID